jgi:hypothetical protein
MGPILASILFVAGTSADITIDAASLVAGWLSFEGL